MGILAPLRDFDLSFDYDIFFRLLRAGHFFIVPMGSLGYRVFNCCLHF